MIGSKKIVCVIPARLHSSRFPKKILALLAGRPLIQWVWEAARSVSMFDDVVFAIDSKETAETIERFHGKFYLTSQECLTGTDRLVELKKRNMVEGDVWVNWQADEPFISERIIMDLLQSCEKDGADIWTLKKRFQDANKAAAPDICKVVCDEDDFALYFSRCPIPFYRTGKEKIYYKHIGLYAYSDKALEEISCLSPCEIELAESLEQLRFLFYGMKIKVHETQEETIGIDVPEHLVKAQEFLKNEQNKGKII